MWTTVLWLSLGITLGVTGSMVYLHLTQQVTVVASAPACVNAIGDAGKTIDSRGTPQGHLPSLSQ